MKTYNKEKLYNKNYVMVLIGQMVSIFGNSILRFALPLYILDQTGSTTIFGTILAISTIPTILFSPIGGILADRVNRRNLMVILDALTAIIIVVFTYYLSMESVVVIVAIMMILFSIIKSFYQPVVQASMPVISSKDNLEKANGMVSLVNAFSNLIGPLFAGILYGTIGIFPIMITGAIAFLLAAIMETFIKMTFKAQQKHSSVFELVKSDFKESLNYVVKKNPIILKAMIVATGMNLFLTSMILIGLPAMIKVNLGLSSQLYGVTQGFIAIGMITGGILISVIGSKLKIYQVYILLVVASVALLPIGLAFGAKLPKMAIYWIITLCCFIMMVMISMFSIKMMSFAQRETPNHLIGKVISFILVITQCTLPLGQALYGVMFERMINSIDNIVFATALCSGIVAVFSKQVFAGLYRHDYQSVTSRKLFKF